MPLKTASSTRFNEFLFGDDVVLKRLNDHRTTKIISLPNQMKIALIHDSSCANAAASMFVRVGSSMNPPELQGLAHFLEHMLFLGSEKYPDEAEYKRFLSQHSGACNASTSPVYTEYHFTVGIDHLDGALDRFAQFFISPKFDASSTERELNAVHSEHTRNLSTTGRRRFMLNSHLANPLNCRNRFHTGDLRTLKYEPEKKGINIREELLSFYNQYYSSNLMNLAIVGRESVEELEAMVRGKFSEVVNKNVNMPLPHELGDYNSPLMLRNGDEMSLTDVPSPPPCIFNPSRPQGEIVIFEPLDEYHILDFHLHYGRKLMRVDENGKKEWIQEYLPETDAYSGIASVLSCILGDESIGSSCANLSFRGKILSLSAGANLDPLSSAPSINFSITIPRKEDVLNVEHINDIISTVSAHLKSLHLSLKDKENKEERQKILDAIKDAVVLKKLNFHLPPPPNALEQVSHLSESLAYLPPSLVHMEPQACLNPFSSEYASSPGKKNPNLMTNSDDLFNIDDAHINYIADRIETILDCMLQSKEEEEEDMPCVSSYFPSMTVSISSKALAEHFTQVEPIFSTPYNVLSLSKMEEDEENQSAYLRSLKGLLREMKEKIFFQPKTRQELDENLQILNSEYSKGPKIDFLGKNPFIPSSLKLNHTREQLPTIYDEPLPDRIEVLSQKSIENQDIPFPACTGFYFPDKYFDVPKSTLRIRLHSRGWMSTRSAANCQMGEEDVLVRIPSGLESITRRLVLDLYLNALLSCLKRDFVYQALMGGLSVDFHSDSNHHSSIVVQISGYDQHIEAFAERVMRAIFEGRSEDGANKKNLPSVNDLQAAISAKIQILNTEISSSKAVSQAQAIAFLDCYDMSSEGRFSSAQEKLKIVESLDVGKILQFFEARNLAEVFKSRKGQFDNLTHFFTKGKLSACEGLHFDIENRESTNERIALDFYSDVLGFGNFKKEDFVAISKVLNLRFNKNDENSIFDGKYDFYVPKNPSTSAACYLLPLSTGTSWSDFLLQLSDEQKQAVSPKNSLKMIIENENKNDRNRFVFWRFDTSSKNPLIPSAVLTNETTTANCATSLSQIPKEMIVKDLVAPIGLKGVDCVRLDGLSNDFNAVMTKMTVQLLKQPFFFQMRTQQKLGYSIGVMEASFNLRRLSNANIPLSTLQKLRFPVSLIGLKTFGVFFYIETSRVGSNRACLRIEDFFKKGFDPEHHSRTAGDAAGDTTSANSSYLLSDGRLESARDSYLKTLEKMPASRKEWWSRISSNLSNMPLCLVTDDEECMKNQFRWRANFHSSLSTAGVDKMRAWLKENLSDCSSRRCVVSEVRLKNEFGMEGEEVEEKDRLEMDLEIEKEVDARQEFQTIYGTRILGDNAENGKVKNPLIQDNYSAIRETLRKIRGWTKS